jgi:hypothetical protein
MISTVMMRTVMKSQKHSDSKAKPEAREAYESRKLDDPLRDVVNHIITDNTTKDGESNLVRRGIVDRVVDSFLLRVLYEDLYNAFDGFINDLLGGVMHPLIPYSKGNGVCIGQRSKWSGWYADCVFLGLPRSRASVASARALALRREHSVPLPLRCVVVEDAQGLVTCGGIHQDAAKVASHKPVTKAEGGVLRCDETARTALSANAGYTCCRCFCKTEMSERSSSSSFASTRVRAGSFSLLPLGTGLLRSSC